MAEDRRVYVAKLGLEGCFAPVPILDGIAALDATADYAERVREIVGAARSGS